MIVHFSPNFDRHYASRLTSRQKLQVLEAIHLFTEQPFHKEFRNHALQGNWAGYRSISVDGDLRVHYQDIAKDTVYFVAVGSHKQLYK